MTTAMAGRMPPLDRRIVIVLMALLFVIDTFTRPIMPINETRYISVAWEMYLNHNWFVPTDNGALYSHKPPLLFWLINLAWLPGVTQAAARLITPAFCLLGLWLTGRLGDATGGSRQAGDGAVMILAGTIPFYFFGGETTFDGMLMTSTLLAAVALWRIGTREEEGESLLPWVGFGAAVALGVYSKGPVILVHVAPMLATMRWWAGPGRLRWRGIALALAVALALVGLWLVPALVTGDPAYREAILWKQSAGRMVNSFAHAKPFWFYLAILPVLLFPWIFLHQFWRWHPLDRGERFLWAWAIGGLVLFSAISGKQAHYLLPEIPAFALLMARRWPERLHRPWVAVAGLGAVVVALVAFSLGAGGKGVAALLPLWVLPVMALPLIAAGWAMLRFPRLVFLSVPALGLALDLGYGVGPAGRIMSPVPLAQELKRHDGQVAALRNDSVFPSDFIFAGRLQHPIRFLETADEIARFAAANPDGVIVSPLDGRLLPDWPPARTVRYRERGLWGIWYPKDG